MGATISTSKSLGKLAKEQASDPYNMISKKLQSFSAGQKKEAEDYRANTEAELGLPQLRETARGLNDQLIGQEKYISAMPDIIKGESRGFDVNANQLAQLTQSKLEPLHKQYSETAREAGRVGGNLASTEGVLGQRMGFLNDRLAREMTGYTKAYETELGGYISKIQRKENLSDWERNRVANLALEEQRFQNNLKSIEAQANAAIRTAVGSREPVSPMQQRIQDLTAQAMEFELQKNKTAYAKSQAPKVNTAAQQQTKQKSVMDQLWNAGGGLVDKTLKFLNLK